MVVLATMRKELLGARIRRARLAIKMTQEQLAAELGVTSPTVSNMELGKVEINATTLASLSRILEVPISELMEGKPSEAVLPAPKVPSVDELIEQIKMRYSLDDIVRVPHLGSVPAVSFVLEDLLRMEADQYDLILAEYLPGVKRPYSLTVKGRCMEYPGVGIRDGDTVVVDPDAPIVDGGVYIVRCDGDVALKRIYHPKEMDKVVLVTGEGATRVRPEAEVVSLGRVVLHGRWQRPVNNHDS
jgi:repressor LexA